MSIVNKWINRSQFTYNCRHLRMSSYLLFVFAFVGLSLRGSARQAPDDCGRRYGRIGRLRARSDFRSVSRARVDEKAPVPRLNLFICNATSNFSNIWIKRDAKKYFLFSGKFGITGLFCRHHRILGHSFTRGCLYGNCKCGEVVGKVLP